MEKEEDKKNLEKSLLFLYTGVILYCLFLGFGRVERSQFLGSYRYSLEISRIPLWLPKTLSRRWIFSMGNLVAFIPLGVLIPINFDSGLIRTSIIFLVFIFCMELLQMVSYLGSFDLEDIFVNTLGLLIGYFSYVLVKKENFLYKKILKFIIYSGGFTLILIIFAEFYNSY